MPLNQTVCGRNRFFIWCTETSGDSSSDVDLSGFLSSAFGMVVSFIVVMLIFVLSVFVYTLFQEKFSNKAVYVFSVLSLFGLIVFSYTIFNGFYYSSGSNTIYMTASILGFFGLAGFLYRLESQYKGGSSQNSFLNLSSSAGFFVVLLAVIFVSLMQSVNTSISIGNGYFLFFDPLTTLLGIVTLFVGYRYGIVFGLLVLISVLLSLPGFDLLGRGIGFHVSELKDVPFAVIYISCLAIPITIYVVQRYLNYDPKLKAMLAVFAAHSMSFIVYQGGLRIIYGNIQNSPNWVQFLMSLPVPIVLTGILVAVIKRKESKNSYSEALVEK